MQRIGRCNRTGDDGPGRVFWIDLDEKLTLPYLQTDLDFAREQLGKLEGRGVSPKELDDFKAHEKITLPFEHKHVLRRRDLLDLFDTAPDLSGNDIDVQRFVRGDDPDTDVQVFWRAIGADGPPDDEPAPQRRELCNVPVGKAREFLEALAEKKRGAGYVWDHLEDEWVKLDPRRIRPGLTILLAASAGGYSDLGWDASSTAPVIPLPPAEKVREEGTASDPNSAIAVALTIAEHTQNVCREMANLSNDLKSLIEEWAERLANSARWHDAGKSHAAFQTGMRRANPLLDSNHQWAKSGTNARLRHGRKHFRHELGSALAVLAQRPDWPFAVAYLIAAHHGKVRLSIRALPGEEPPDEPTIRFALGVRDGDELPEVDLDGETCAKTILDLTPMQLGGETSWTGRALKLLAELGPFKLAYLETMLRAADVRASRKEANNA